MKPGIINAVFGYPHFGHEHLPSIPTPDGKPFDPPKGSFQADLEKLINRHSIEGGSNTPDFILACFMRQCLEAFDMATRRRDEHRK